MPSSAKFSEPTSSLAAGIPKSRTAGIPSGPDPVHLAVEHLVHRELENAGHGADLALDTGAVDHEDRLNQISGAKLVLAHQPADGLRYGEDGGDGWR